MQLISPKAIQSKLGTRKNGHMKVTANGVILTTSRTECRLVYTITCTGIINPIRTVTK